MGIEGLFMEWIVRALKPGKKAFIVVPDGIMNRSNDKKLRDFILGQCDIDAVISLPLNTFFTTNKKTYILALTKRFLLMLAEFPLFPSKSLRYSHIFAQKSAKRGMSIALISSKMIWKRPRICLICLREQR